jgi:hypothetical protein
VEVEDLRRCRGAVCLHLLLSLPEALDEWHQVSQRLAAARFCCQDEVSSFESGWYGDALHILLV